jgi:hypothetical protein
MAIAELSGELEEAAWWDYPRGEVEVDSPAKLTNPADGMSSGKRRRADCES